MTRALIRDYGGTVGVIAGMSYIHLGSRLRGHSSPNKDIRAVNKARPVKDAGLSIGVVGLNVLGGDNNAQIHAPQAAGAKIVPLTTALVSVSKRDLVVKRGPAFDAWLPPFATPGARRRDAGLTRVYHNHLWDSKPLEGDQLLDLMADLIAARELAFKVDLASCWYAEVEPLNLLTRLRGRRRSLHSMDIDRTPGKCPVEQAAIIGSGEIRYSWDAVGDIEVDHPADELRAVADGARYFRKFN